MASDFGLHCREIKINIPYHTAQVRQKFAARECATANIKNGGAISFPSKLNIARGMLRGGCNIEFGCTGGWGVRQSMCQPYPLMHECKEERKRSDTELSW